MTLDIMSVSAPYTRADGRHAVKYITTARIGDSAVSFTSKYKYQARNLIDLLTSVDAPRLNRMWKESLRISKKTGVRRVYAFLKLVKSYNRDVPVKLTIGTSYLL